MTNKFNDWISIESTPEKEKPLAVYNKWEEWFGTGYWDGRSYKSINYPHNPLKVTHWFPLPPTEAF